MAIVFSENTNDTKTLVFLENIDENARVKIL